MCCPSILQLVGRRGPMTEPTIDWASFSDCIMATNWSRPIDLKRQFGFSQSTVDSAWHGRPIGLAPFLRICRAMKISPLDFLGDEK